MNNIKARQYAQAIYDIGKENKLEEDYLDLSMALIDVGNSSPEFYAYLGSPAVNHEDKKELINTVIDDKSNYYIHWLYILIESGRTKYIKDYIKEYIKLYNEEHNILTGTAYTTEKVDAKVLKKLGDIISKKYNKEIVIENKIDKTIIGGIKLQVEDDVWDNTIRNKLIQLLKEGEKHE